MIFADLTVERNVEIARNTFEMTFHLENIRNDIKAGQFINIYPKNPSLTLPRPISVCNVTESRLMVVYRVAGKGTGEFSTYMPGDVVKIMLPLGNGFDLTMAEAGGKAILIGGGIGAPPLLLAANRLMEMGIDFSVFLGFVNEPILIEQFKELTDNVFVATETGAYGVKGYVTDLLNSSNSGGIFYACGPAPMLKAVSRYMAERDGNGQISMEQRMACGFGACVGCAVKTKSENSAGFRYAKACKDGPVFDYKEIIWD